MIIESRKMRDCLNTSILQSRSSQKLKSYQETWLPPKSHRRSMNLMPALVILLLGKMMSAHHQESELSTTLHVQWGTMFMGFALARGVTYALMYLAPPTSYLPSRPPSELIAAFCLIAGGLIFMQSSRDVVTMLESYHLNAMFTFTVTVGFTALIMAWTTLLVAIKGWAARKEGQVAVREPHADGLE